MINDPLIFLYSRFDMMVQLAEASLNVKHEINMYLQLNAILNRINHPIAKSTTMHSPSFKAITFMLLGLMVLTSCRKVPTVKP